MGKINKENPATKNDEKSNENIVYQVESISNHTKLLLIGCVGLIVSFFLPWFSIELPFVTTLNISGYSMFDYSDKASRYSSLISSELSEIFSYVNILFLSIFVLSIITIIFILLKKNAKILGILTSTDALLCFIVTNAYLSKFLTAIDTHLSVLKAAGLGQYLLIISSISILAGTFIKQKKPKEISIKKDDTKLTSNPSNKIMNIGNSVKANLANNKFSQINEFDYIELLYDSQCPIKIKNISLLMNNSKNEVKCNIDCFNSYNTPFKAIKYDILCYDSFNNPINNELNNIVPVTHQDLNCSSYESYTLSSILSLENAITTRKAKIIIKSIVFSDGFIWEKGNNELITIRLEQINDMDEKKLLKNLLGSNTIYYPQETENHWTCLCGLINEKESEKCPFCKREKTIVLNDYNKKSLLEKKEAFIQQEAEKERLRKEKLEQTKQDIKEKCLENIGKLKEQKTKAVHTLNSFIKKIKTHNYKKYLTKRNTSIAIVLSVLIICIAAYTNISYHNLLNKTVGVWCDQDMNHNNYIYNIKEDGTIIIVPRTTYTDNTGDFVINHNTIKFTYYDDDSNNIEETYTISFTNNHLVLKNSSNEMIELEPMNEQLFNNREQFDGEFYEIKGEWIDDCYTGTGILYFMDGSYYEGDFKENEMYGKGMLLSQDGIKIYEGDFVNNTMHGNGIYYYENGNAMYDGNWNDGCISGKGTYYSEDKKLLYKGNFSNSIAQGNGKVFLEDEKSYFEGTFKDGTPVKGTYKLFDKDDNIQSGTVVDEFYAITPQFDEYGFLLDSLIMAKIGDKWGYVDKEGKMVINPQFDLARSFANNEEIARVKVDSNWGYINKLGKYILKPNYDLVKPFSQGLGAVKDKDHKWGYINKQGHYAIQPQFKEATAFSEDLAAVKNKDYEWGYINKQGHYVIQPQFKEATAFSEGLATVRIGNEWGYIDKNGNYIINPQFQKANAFSEGLAAVKIGHKWGYIDKNGNYVVNPQFKDINNFSEGFAAVKDEDYRWGYIHKTGNYIVVPQFKDVLSFSEGFAAVKNEDSRWGYIDKNGDYMIAPQFKDAVDFSEGLAAVKDENSKWGYIDKNYMIHFKNIYIMIGE